MSTEYLQHLDPDRRQAVRELTAMIRARYPRAEFQVEAGIDDREATHITAMVDVDDPDEVMDLIIDRLVEMQVDAGLPISVIPIRTPERTAALSAGTQQVKRSKALLPPAPV